jgi:hypothetical protein
MKSTFLAVYFSQTVSNLGSKIITFWTVYLVGRLINRAANFDRMDQKICKFYAN